MTVHPVEPFLSGYRHFKSAGYENQRALYTHLEQGQSPTAAIIACADSRVDPATIFAAAPGELFVIRNVGNMVPPFDSEGGVHGVSAAVEFAVQMLGVSEVLIMGHGQCGGIAACLEAVDTAPVGTFIAPWVEIIAPARARVLADPQVADSGPERQTALERAAIGVSLENLMSFPFVAEKVQTGSLRLHGAWFAIASGELHWRNPGTGGFDVVSDQPV